MAYITQNRRIAEILKIIRRSNTSRGLSQKTICEQFRQKFSHIPNHEIRDTLLQAEKAKQVQKINGRYMLQYTSRKTRNGRERHKSATSSNNVAKSRRRVIYRIRVSPAKSKIVRKSINLRSGTKTLTKSNLKIEQTSQSNLNLEESDRSKKPEDLQSPNESESNNLERTQSKCSSSKRENSLSEKTNTLPANEKNNSTQEAGQSNLQESNKAEVAENSSSFNERKIERITRSQYQRSNCEKDNPFGEKTNANKGKFHLAQKASGSSSKGSNNSDGSEGSRSFIQRKTEKRKKTKCQSTSCERKKSFNKKTDSSSTDRKISLTEKAGQSNLQGSNHSDDSENSYSINERNAEKRKAIKHHSTNCQKKNVFSEKIKNLLARRKIYLTPKPSWSSSKESNHSGNSEENSCSLNNRKTVKRKRNFSNDKTNNLDSSINSSSLEIIKKRRKSKRLCSRFKKMDSLKAKSNSPRKKNISSRKLRSTSSDLGEKISVGEVTTSDTSVQYIDSTNSLPENVSSEETSIVNRPGLLSNLASGFRKVFILPIIDPFCELDE